MIQIGNVFLHIKSGALPKIKQCADGEADFDIVYSTASRIFEIETAATLEILRKDT